jgi:hypothetical protein
VPCCRVLRVREFVPATHRSSAVAPSRSQVGLRNPSRLRVAPRGDAHEREADRVADEVARGRDVGPLAQAPVGIQRSCTSCAGEDELVQRKCATCAAEGEETVRGKDIGNAGGGALDAATTASVDAVRGATGQPLSAPVQGLVDRRFGLDLSHVRVHTDETAAAAARRLSARAFTVGHHIAFEHGTYAPATRTGLHLLAHELAHVVQQDSTIRRAPVDGAAGRPFAGDERSFFESRYGRSLAHVRVHDGAEAASRARGLGAAAYSYGHDVVLGAGHPAGSPARRHVLAHELAHVLQYRGTAAADRFEVGAPDAAAEGEAELAGQRVLAGQPASVTARDAAPIVRRVIPSKECVNEEHSGRILQWIVHISYIRTTLEDDKYRAVRVRLLTELDFALAMMKGYQACGRVSGVPSTGMVGLLDLPSAAPMVAPEIAPIAEPVIETPAPETPGGMSGGGFGWGIVISVAAATLQYGINRALSPSPSGQPITFDDLQQIMQKIDADFASAKKAAEVSAEPAPTPEPAPKAKAKADPDADLDPDEKPDDEPRSCDLKDRTCKQVPIPRKGGDSKYTRRHNRCADAVTIPSYQGKDVCINGRAFDAVDAEGTLWEVKAHAWSHATIYKDPKMAAKIAKNVAYDVFEELLVARHCGKAFKLGVKDPAMKPAIKKYLPGLDIVVLKC